MNNKTVRSFWTGNQLTNLEKLSISSYIHNGHEIEVFTYNRNLDFPTGTIARDANEIIPESKIFVDSRGGYASFSDWFRFKMIFELGGWWTDLDSVCLKHLDIASEYCFALQDERAISIQCANFKAPKGAEFLEDCLDTIDSLIKKKEFIWGNFGIDLLWRVVSNYDYKPYLLSSEYFYPVKYMDVKDLISKKSIALSPETYTVHFWNEMWRIENLDKNGKYPETSLFETLKTRYLSI